MTRSHLREATWAVALVALIASALALAACGDSTTPSTATPPTALPTRTTPVAAYSFPPQQQRDFSETTDGLEFVPWVDIEVSALGYYDAGGDGLQYAHRVGIFDAADGGTVAVVQVDSQSPLQDGFRYEALAPSRLLKAGRSYVVAGESPREPIPNRPKGLAWVPELRFVDCRWSRDWGFPESNDTDWEVMAINFLFMPVSAASPTP